MLASVARFVALLLALAAFARVVIAQDDKAKVDPPTRIVEFVAPPDTEPRKVTWTVVLGRTRGDGEHCLIKRFRVTSVPE